jgi:filamentous hemagglutinin family protein
MKTQLLFLLLIISLSAPAQITTDGTLGPALSLPGPDYQIGPNLGRQMGGNLFHSFQDFNLNSAESATFFGPNHIQNVISRVTGGNPSRIDGLFRSTIPGADVYFLNPYGILFGPNARLDVQGSFHASTAHYLRLGDGGRFEAQNPNNSILTVAPVEIFGFLNSPVAPISIQGHGEVTQELETGLSVPEGKTLSLIGGPIEMWMGTFFKIMAVDDDGNESIEITNLPMLSAPSGRINIAAVASQGEVKLGGDFVDITSFSQLTDIHIKENTWLQTTGEGGGSILIRGGQFFADDSTIEAKTLGSMDGGVIDIQANAISLTNGATINGNTEGTGKGTDILLHAVDSLKVIGENSEAKRSAILSRSGIFSELTDDNLGNAGKIDLEAKNILFKDGSVISVSTYGGGKGGNIRLKASELVAVVGEGREDGTAIAVATYGETGGDAGSLLIEAQNISFTDGAYMTSTTKGKGQGGNVTLKASDTVIFEGESSNGIASFIVSVTTFKGDGAGNAGTLLIEANNISFTDGAEINSNTYGKGNADTVTLHANNMLKLTGVSKDGKASQIYVTTDGTGNAGNIFVTAQDVLLNDGAYIISTSFGTGKAGNIHVHATGKITIAGASKRGWGSAISADSNPKKEGIIGGQGGNITIEADKLVLKDGGHIAASSIAPKGIQSSQGGNISIRVQGAVELSGVNPYGENEDGFSSGIYARSIGVGNNAGDGGNITLQADSLMIREGAVIISSTNNNAKGGNIDIDVRGAITITGDASNIPLREPAKSQLEYLQDFSPNDYNQSTSGIYAGSSSSSAQAGAGGNINLTAQNLSLKDKGTISATSAGGGQGGGNAGTITITSSDGFHLSNSSQITTEAKRAGGGQITLKTDGLLRVVNSEISSSVQEGSGNGGNLKLSPKFIILENGKIIARAYEGDGGNMNITTTSIYRFGDEAASPIDASSKLGVDGEITVNSPDTDISGQLLVLSTDMINAEEQMQPPCSSRLAENLSSFVVAPNEGVPNMPDDLLPSGPQLSKVGPAKTTKSVKPRSTTPHPQMASQTGCQPQSSTKRENSVMPEQLF